MSEHQTVPHADEVVGFRQMIDGTKADYDLLQRLEHEYIADLPSRLVASLRALDSGLAGYPVSRYVHSLQSATRAEVDGADVARVDGDAHDDVAAFGELFGVEVVFGVARGLAPTTDRLNIHAGKLGISWRWRLNGQRFDVALRKGREGAEGRADDAAVKRFELRKVVGHPQVDSGEGDPRAELRL